MNQIVKTVLRRLPLSVAPLRFSPAYFSVPAYSPPSLCSSLHTSSSFLKTFEPDYLDTEGISIPTYPLLNIQVKGYNFDILEEFQSWVHRMAENMGVDVKEAWATPAQSLEISTYHEGGVRIKDTYQVHLYERNIQVLNLRSVDAGILIDLVQRALPEGVSFSFLPHTVEAEELRWIKDPFIDSLRNELAEGQEDKEAEAAKKAKINEERAARKKEMLLKSLQE